MAAYLGDYIIHDDLNHLIANGYISVQKHPQWPLYILNYTHKTQIEGKWNDITKRCRGLILYSDILIGANIRGVGKKVEFRGTEEIVATPLMKFWNLNEREESSEDAFKQIRLGTGNRLSFVEKLDGSMGIVYNYYNENTGDFYKGVATRGSFTSTQAVWATKWAQNNIREWPPSTYGYIVEIISPVSRIVVDYKYEGLVLLAVTTNHFKECKRREIKKYALAADLTVAKTYPGMTFLRAMAETKKNFEGYIAHVFNGRTYTRAKIKTEDYVRLHRLITNVSPRKVWEIISSGEDITEYIGADKPQHFRDFFKGWAKTLTAQYAARELEAKKLFAGIQNSVMKKNPNPLRKDYALAFAQHGDFSAVLFNMLDNQDYSAVLWKKLKPKITDSYITEEDEE